MRAVAFKERTEIGPGKAFESKCGAMPCFGGYSFKVTEFDFTRSSNGGMFLSHSFGGP